MNKSILPNARFISLPSSQIGRDWYEVTLKLDSVLEELGLELLEEVVYLHYGSAPGMVIEGSAECRIARSVIGPLKKLEGDYKITDWTQGLVYKIPLSANSWDDLLAQCYKAWENLVRMAIKPTSQFTISLKRELKDTLQHKVEVIFYEG